MAESLFTSQTPVSGDNTDGGAAGITTATSMLFAVDGEITHVRFYTTTTVTGTYTVGVWQVGGSDPSGSGTLLASKTTTGPLTAGTWNTLALDTPVPVTASTVLYRVGLWNSDGRYVASTGGSSPWPLTNGNITAPAHGSDPVGFGSMSQGTFKDNAAFGYPTTNFNNGCYFIDVVFEPSGSSAGDIAPSGIAVTAALGTPTLAQSLSVAPSGIAVAASLGTPTLSQGGIAPSGIAVTAALGTPTLAQSLAVTPSGIAVTAGVGTPTLAQSLAVVPDGIAVTAGLGTPTVSQTVEPGFAITPDGIAVVVLLGTPALEQAGDQGSWESLSAIVREARIDHQHNQERERNPLDCPEHGWPLERTPRGLHCKFGGHVVR